MERYEQLRLIVEDHSREYKCAGCGDHYFTPAFVWVEVSESSPGGVLEESFVCYNCPECVGAWLLTEDDPDFLGALNKELEKKH